MRLHRHSFNPIVAKSTRCFKMDGLVDLGSPLRPTAFSFIAVRHFGKISREKRLLDRYRKIELAQMETPNGRWRILILGQGPSCAFGGAQSDSEIALTIQPCRW